MRPGWFTQDELRVLAGLLTPTGRPLPLPLQVRCSAKTVGDLRRTELDGHQRLTGGGEVHGARLEPDLEGALRTLTMPAVWVDDLAWPSTQTKIEGVSRFYSGTGWRVLPS